MYIKDINTHRIDKNLAYDLGHLLTCGFAAALAIKAPSVQLDEIKIVLILIN